MQKGAWTIAPLMSVIDGMLHPSVREKGRDRQRHAIFMIVHLGLAVIGLALLPAYILTFRPQGISQALLPIWMLAPLISGVYLTRTGNLAKAFLLSAGLAAAFICWIASMTGGFHSPHLIWLGVIPLEVALSGNRKIVKSALLICLAAVAVLWSVSIASLMQEASHQINQLVGSASVIAAILYGGLLALRIESLHRKQISKARQAESRYRAIADTLSDMVTRHDMSGDVTHASLATQTLLGIGPERIYGNGLFQYVHIPDRPTYLQALSDCINRGSNSDQPITVELRMMRAQSRPQTVCKSNEATDRLCQGGLIWTEMKLVAERDAEGKIVGAVATSRDICKRKRHQMELEKARNDAEHASIAKTRFLANVTHELRTPLNTVIGFSELLSKPELVKTSLAQQKEYLELIHNSGHHLLELVNALLDMSRIESGNFEVEAQEFNLQNLIGDCCKMMQPDAEQKQIALYQKIDGDIPDINADPRACRQILLNLISNALKFSDADSQVKVTLNWAKLPNGALDKNSIEMQVCDQGIGIAAADIDKLGTPFMQAENALHRRFEGAGIGLSIVKGLVALQQGKMDIKSSLGNGTTITIRLPLDMNAHQATQEPESVVSLEPSEPVAPAIDQNIEAALEAKSNKRSVKSHVA